MNVLCAVMVEIASRSDKKMISCIAFAKNKTVDIIRPLSAHEVEIIDEVGKMLSTIKYYDNMFVLALSEWEELNEFLESHSRKTKEGKTYDTHEFFLKINNKLTNYLSNARKFIDHSEIKIYQEYGKNSPQSELWNDEKKMLYNGFFSYRFLYHLRHFTQHNGSMPLNRFSKKIVPTKLGEDRVLEIEVSRDSLLNTSFNWNSAVKKEIEEMPQSFDITGYLLEHKVCLQALYHKIIEILAVEVTNSFKDYIELLSSFHISGYPYVFKFEDEESQRDPSNYKNMSQLPFQDIYKYLEKMSETSVVKLNYKKKD
ncbi:hypothetical protein [Sporosarcina psychrophila]|uniref:Uncharacterized protein n=1 Tax=Sporosarcina psychrophila TaxID=1476 RepID=A0ABV2KBY5_SPOPS